MAAPIGRSALRVREDLTIHVKQHRDSEARTNRLHPRPETIYPEEKMPYRTTTPDLPSAAPSRDPANGPLLADAAGLPPVLGLVTAAAWLGIGRTTAYRLAEAGEFPAPVIRAGWCYRVPTAPLLAVLGIRPETGVD